MDGDACDEKIVKLRMSYYIPTICTIMTTDATVPKGDGVSSQLVFIQPEYRRGSQLMLI